MIADPTQGHEVSEMTISIDMGSQKRSDIEQLRCDDPTCQADHGFMARSYPDDISLRVSQLADGSRTYTDAQVMVDALLEVVRNAH